MEDHFGKYKAISKGLALSLSLGAYACGMIIFCAVAMATKNMPSAETLWKPNRPVSIQIVDRYGRDILVRGASFAPRVKLSNLPAHVPATIIAAEDRRFRYHVGLDPKALTRAMVKNIKAGRYVEGGSTLTQQLSKNVFLTPNKTLRRKAQEMMLSIWLEQAFTKDEILEMYLSRVYFGSGAWGLEAASKRYLGKSANELTIAEGAMMAGLLKAPSLYNPVSAPERSSKRTAIVLELMAQQNLIDHYTHYRSLTDVIEIRRAQSDNSAQYFVDWIWPYLEDAVGTPTQDMVVQTTLDLEAQIQANQSLNQRLDSKRNATQGALVSLDGTGGVLAMVGGRDYTQSQFNRAAQAQRQPGSAFKPFVYLTALRAGLTPWDSREDKPIKIGDWEPENFTEEFKGKMTLENAFRNSINSIAVGLAEEVGRQQVIDTASEFGLKDLEPLRSLALGAQATSPLQLTASYLPFSNYGKTGDPYGILSVSTADGTPLYDRSVQNNPRILSAQNLSHMNRMMTRAVELGTGRRAVIKGRHIGGKTGTTNDFRDAWFVGYAPDIVTGVWVGADDFTPMDKVTGGSIPATIWKDFMETALQDMPKTSLPVSAEPIWKRQENVLDSLLSDIEDALP